VTGSPAEARREIALPINLLQTQVRVGPKRQNPGHLIRQREKLRYSFEIKNEGEAIMSSNTAITYLVILVSPEDESRFPKRDRLILAEQADLGSKVTYEGREYLLYGFDFNPIPQILLIPMNLKELRYYP